MQIKNVLKALTDNSLVKVEKIGSGNYYWAFPSDTKVAIKLKIEKLTQSITSLESELVNLQSQLDQEEKSRISTVN